MVRFINRISGGDMWVHESRVKEYLALGHSLAPPPTPAHPLRSGETQGPEEPKAEPEEPKPKRARKKKTETG